MRHPQVLVLSFDDWLAKQLREFTNEHHWTLQETRQLPASRMILRVPRPTVLVLQLDPHADNLIERLELLADVHRTCPWVACVVVSDVKMNEEDRATWTATAFDLGARYILFPPLARPVLEDLVGGLMASLTQQALPPPVPEAHEPVIDLAQAEAHE